MNINRLKNGQSPRFLLIPDGNLTQGHSEFTSSSQPIDSIILSSETRDHGLNSGSPALAFLAQNLVESMPDTESIKGLLQDRPDLELGDFLEPDSNGNLRINPAAQDPEAQTLLKLRPDIHPRELAFMKRTLTKSLRSSGLGQDASKLALELLNLRPDLNPEDAGALLSSLAKTGGSVESMSSSIKLLSKRTDINPEQVTDLATSVGRSGSSGKSGRGAQGSEGLHAALKALEKDSLRPPEEMSQASGPALAATAELFGENSKIDHQSIHRVLQEAADRKPDGPDRSAQRPSSILRDVAAGVKRGTIDRDNLMTYFDTAEAEAAGLGGQT